MARKPADLKRPDATEGETAAPRQIGWRDFRVEHIGITFAVVAALFGSAMYFTGVQFEDSKAQALGLAGRLGDPSFQETAARGFGAVVASIFVLDTTLVFIGSALLLVIAVYVFRMVRKPVWDYGDEEHFRNLSPEMFDDLKRFERTVRRFKLFTVVMMVVSLAIVLALMLTIGRLAGEDAANEILTRVSGKCSDCMIFQGKGRSVVGVAALQSKDQLIVATSKGLVGFALNEPVQVNWPVGYAETKLKNRSKLAKYRCCAAVD